MSATQQMDVFQRLLEKEIIDYLSKKQPCALATCGKDGIPESVHGSESALWAFLLVT